MKAVPLHSPDEADHISIDDKDPTTSCGWKSAASPKGAGGTKSLNLALYLQDALSAPRLLVMCKCSLKGTDAAFVDRSSQCYLSGPFDMVRSNLRESSPALPQIFTINDVEFHDCHSIHSQSCYHLLDLCWTVAGRRGSSHANTVGVQGGGEDGYLDSCPHSNVLRRHRDIRC